MVTLVNRAKMSTATTGTGTITLGSAVAGFQSFADAGVVDGNVVRYVIEDGSEFEIGVGTFGSAGGTLTRTVSESSNADAALNLTGDAVVFVGATAADIQQPPFEGAFVDGDKTKLDNIEAGAQVNVPTNLAITGTGNTRTITSSTGTNVTIPVATGTTAGWLSTTDKTKLDGIAAGAQVNVATNLGYTTAASTGTVTSSNGTNATLPAATTTLAGLLTGADKTKLDGIASGATANSGTVTSVAATSGTGISVTGSPVTTSGTLTITNTSPHIATNLSATSGTTAGPSINSSTGTNVVIPSASATASGIVTTGTQTLAGVKTFSSTITGDVSGNASTATALQTARTIGGVSFNGTANINLPGVNTGGNQNTTGSAASLTTARTLTIGGTGKTFNGTANVAWSLAEIGVNNATLTLATSGIATGSQTFTANQGTAATFTVNVPATNLSYSTAATTGTVNSSTGTNVTLPAATTLLAGLLTGADKTKLDGIATGAQVNVPTNLAITGTGNTRTITSSTGTNVTIPVATGTTAGWLSTTDKTKLNGIAAGAQVNTVTSVAGKTGAVALAVADVSGAFPASAIPAGTKMLFAQTTAPTGWTKDMTHNNKALRVVSGTAGSGGSFPFTDVFVNRTTTNTAAGGTVAGHSLTRNQNATHNHDYHVAYRLGGGAIGVNGDNLAGASTNAFFGTFAAIPVQGTSNDGASEAHAHGFTGAAHNHNLEMSVQYVDIIIATKG